MRWEFVIKWFENDGELLNWAKQDEILKDLYVDMAVKKWSYERMT